MYQHKNVISNYDVENLYELPRMLLDQKKWMI